MKDVKVSVSILSSDLGSLNEEVAMMEEAGVDRIHFDVMDGHFVPNLSFGVPLLKRMKTKLPVEVHLMVENPLDFLGHYKQAFEYQGADLTEQVILVHAELFEDLSKVLGEIRAYGFKAGLVLKPKTSIETIKDVLDELDQVLIMSVEPGYSGQKFRPEVLEKVKLLRELKPDLAIEMDGGINAETSVLAREAGANILVSASFLFGSEDKKEAVRSLKV